MIWDFIRDFLVQYIFGGTASDGDVYNGFISVNADDGAEFGTYATMINLNITNDLGDTMRISVGDWLSTTTTIIIMCAIVFLFALLVRWVFKAVTSAFLLK